MQMSKFNIISQIHDSDYHFIVNALSGQADILEPEVGRAVVRGEIPDREAFINKGYLVDPDDEMRNYRQKYLDFIDRREKDEIQIFFVPWYSCNFKCTYCYQDLYNNDPGELLPEIVDAFYSYVEKRFTGRRKYITLFGGEPLLAGKTAQNAVENFLNGAWSRNIEISVVTNGYNLIDYTAFFAGKSIREIQVTLDGTEDVHNARRMLKSGTKKSFTRIVEGIDSALEKNLKINLRVVVDKNNIKNLPELANFAVNKGWATNPLFKTQIGRNYELHHCSADPQNLFSRIELYQKLYEICRDNPNFLQFHKPAFSITRFLYENGSLPDPLFDACPGCKTEWAFDYTGSIYSCTATVGKKDQKLGSFYPHVELDEDAVDVWDSRDITTIEKCKSCSLSLMCGGGCAAVASANGGSILAPDCRPVAGTIGLGISNYFRKELTNE